MDNDKLQAVHTLAKQRLEKIHSAVWEERIQCVEDRKFYTVRGSQWEGGFLNDVEANKNRPKIESNTVHLSVLRIINTYRNNRVSVKFAARDGVEDSKLADACASLFRACEQNSSAEEAYDNGFEEAVGGGMGAWRLRTDYDTEDFEEDIENQHVYIEPIYEADSCVFFDLGAKLYDKSDAKFCFVVNPMTKEDYEEEFGGEAPSSIELGSSTTFTWSKADLVNVVEYYLIEEKKENQFTFSSDVGQEIKYFEDELTEDPSILDELLGTGFSQTGIKKIKRRKVRKYIMDGVRILEDCGYIAGKYIPIITTYGKRTVLGGVERIMGQVRLLKDAQRLKNLQLSTLAEIAATSTVKTPILLPEQVLGVEHRWANVASEKRPYLLIKPVDLGNGQLQPLPPVGYLEPPTVPPALAALIEISNSDLQQIAGNQEQGERLVANTSSKAIELIQNQIGEQSSIYLDNLSRSIKRTGQVWLSMAQDIYTKKGRKLKGVGVDGESSVIELKKASRGEDDMAVLENDFSRASFDVVTTVGASSSSQKQSIVNNLTTILSMMPEGEDKSILLSYSLMNLEGEGISDARKYFRTKLVRAGVVTPTEQEQKMLQEEAANAQPDPQAEFLKASAMSEAAKAKKYEADVGLTLAKTELVSAQAAETVGGMDLNRAEKITNMIKNLQPKGSDIGGGVSATKNKQTVSVTPTSNE